ncbi:MAG: AMP-binding protein [Acidobacteria bacterium]|nr:AMP-binding protein [Acidobacteriota bacterium]
MHDTNLLEDQPIAWTPTPEVVERAQLTKFMRQVGVTTWDELYQFSIRDVEKFTEEVLKFLDIKFDPPYSELLDISKGIEFPKWFSTAADSERSSLIPHPSSLSAGLNITEMCLDRWQTDDVKDQPAVIWEGEDGSNEMLSYAQLSDRVEKCAAGLRADGLGKGDSIGIHLPMIPETVIALLAINRIGAIAVPVFSGYGVEAIVSRMNAVGAKALFTSLGFRRRGKELHSSGLEAAGKCPTVRTLFLIPPKSLEKPLRQRTKDQIQRSRTEFEGYLAMSDEERHEYLQTQELLAAKKNPQKQQDSVHESGGARISFEIYDLKREPVDYPSLIVFWSELLNLGSGPRIEPTSAEDPLIILYTSGTTGKPKGIAHTHASFPIKAAQDMAFGTDVGKGTRICWYTDIGWMMGPWLIYGALINGATICIYDGAPDYPTPDRMWEFCAKHKVEVLGISPTLVRALAAHEAEPPVSAGGKDAGEISTLETKRDDDDRATSTPPAYAGGSAPFERHDLSALRIFASTGEPWNPAPWWWLFEKVGNSKLPIINYSGGTEIAGGILMGNPLLPIKPCSFPAPCPGMDVDILNENGEPVKPGEVGELVIKQPWIGMARGFWQEKERYLETYWSRFKNIWVHGDWAMRDADGHWFILGRSDDTLKVAGKRVGPAEVESLLVAHPLVTEAAVIGVPDEAKGTAMVAFVVLNDELLVVSDGHSESNNSSLTTHHSSLQQELKALVAKDMGKPLAPSKIHFVSALPKTRNAKVMRRVIRSAYLGEDPGDLSALENPQSVEEIRAFNK